MSKERYNQIIDEAYDNYKKDQNGIIGSDWTYRLSNSSGHDLFRLYTKEEFVEKCKKDPKFWSEWTLSEKWGLKIEERELSWEERRDLLTPSQYDGTALNKYGKEDCGFGDISPFTDKVIHYWLDLHNIPTKLITITYNNETIESYE